MTKNTPKWFIEKNGTLKFTSGMKVIKARYKPDSLFEYPFLSYFFLALFGAIDVTLFYQLLVPIVNDNKFILIVGLLALAAGMDFAPIYLATELHKKKQGYKTDDIMLWPLFLTFVLAFLANCYMRYVFRSTAIADMSKFNSAGDGIVESSPYSAAYSVFCAILPLVTSLCSFGISYALSNPIRTALRKVEKIGEMLNEDINQTEAVLASISADENMLQRMISEDTDYYECSIAMVRERALEYSDYVRQRIKEHMGEAAALNELSKEHRDEFISKLQGASDRYEAEGSGHISCLFESLQGVE